MSCLRYDESGRGDPPLLLVHGFTGAALDFVDVFDDARAVATGRGLRPARARRQHEHRRREHLHLRSIDDRPRDLRRRSRSRADASPRSLDGRDGRVEVRADVPGARALTDPDGHRGCSGTAASPTCSVASPRSAASRAWTGSSPSCGSSGSSRRKRPALRRTRSCWRRVESKFSRMDPEAFAALADELGSYPSMVERLGEISCPTTVIVGEHDTGLRACRRRVRRARPRRGPGR